MMSKYSGLLSLVTVFCIASCSSTKNVRVWKGAMIYQIESNAGDKVKTYELVNGKKFTVNQSDQGITLSTDDFTCMKKLDTDLTPSSGYIRDQFRLGVGSKFYYPDIDASKDDALHVDKVTYSKFDFKLQAVNITFKNRRSLRDDIIPAVADSFPNTWNSGFTPALALGGTQEITWFNQSKKAHTISITGGVFYGLGTTKLDKNTTRLPVYSLSRTALTHNYGGYINLGYQKWDVGFAFGWESASGIGSESWVYQNQLFNGIIIGYDIVKLRK